MARYPKHSGRRSVPKKAAGLSTGDKINSAGVCPRWGQRLKFAN
jgi:hypothetical protein